MISIDEDPILIYNLQTGERMHKLNTLPGIEKDDISPSESFLTSTSLFIIVNKMYKEEKLNQLVQLDLKSGTQQVLVL